MGVECFDGDGVDHFALMNPDQQAQELIRQGLTIENTAKRLCEQDGARLFKSEMPLVMKTSSDGITKEVTFTFRSTTERGSDHAYIEGKMKRPPNTMVMDPLKIRVYSDRQIFFASGLVSFHEKSFDVIPRREQEPVTIRVTMKGKILNQTPRQ